MKYYTDLVNDKRRVSIFKKAIQKNAKGTTYDLGTGSGILASIASAYSKKVYAIENNHAVIKNFTKKNLSKYPNITLIEDDATSIIFPELADVIICEMLDTALIDEEQAPVINNALKYKKNDCIFIPHSTYDTLQLISTNIPYITYFENGKPEFTELSDEIIYNKVVFSESIETNFSKEVKVEVKSKGILNALMITTYTNVTEKLVTGPTPMLNPPLFIPLDEVDVSVGDIITIDLKYTMGGGLDTIKANIK